MISYFRILCLLVLISGWGFGLGHSHAYDEIPAFEITRSDGIEPPAASAALDEEEPASRTSTAANADAWDAVLAGEDFEYDPWESFNERMFWFNREVLDRYLVKPAATAWDFILPDPVQRGVHNIFDNLAVVRRVVNNTLQWRLADAGRELARFTINTTIGVVGFFDVAKDSFGIEQSDQDMGLTFGVWGIGPGPYLVLPFLPPLTVRDGIGYAIDSAMTPYVYFLPWYVTFSGNATNVVNERSLHLEQFERVAETTIDLYGAVRNAYLQSRAAAIKR